MWIRSRIAAYFHTDYALTDRFTLTVGGRYSKETKQFIGGQADLNGFSYKISGCNPPGDLAGNHIPGLPPDLAALSCRAFLGFPEADQPLRYFPDGTNEQKFNVFTPKFGGQFQLTDDVMVYASWSKGFKSGGWTTRLSQPIQSGEEAEFGPEFAKTTEVGIKSELFGRRVLVNAAAFYTDYEGVQLNFQEGASPVLHNAGDAKIKGFEIESTAILGGGFSINFAGGYMDAYYTEIAPEARIPISNKLPKTPEYKVDNRTELSSVAGQRRLHALLGGLHADRGVVQRLAEYAGAAPARDQLAQRRDHVPGAGRQLRDRPRRHEPDERSLAHDGIDQSRRG